MVAVCAGCLIVIAPWADAKVSAGEAGSGFDRVWPTNATYTLSWPVAQQSPSGCEQNSHDPHESHHQPGRMNGEVRATCRTPVPRMTHTAQMWETRWWGWDKVGINGHFEQRGVRRGSAFGNDACRKNWVRVTGDGEITDVDTRTYHASTESTHVDNPCRL
jgi:hypothetical protein